MDIILIVMFVVLIVALLLPNIKKFSMDFNLSERQVIIFLILIILLSSFLRIYRLDNSIWTDEAHSIDRARPDIYSIVTYLGDVHPPLYFIFLHYWIKLFGDSEFSARFLSSIFGIIAVYVIYRTGREFFNKDVGLISSLILSISLFAINYSQEIRQYSLVLLLTLISNFYFMKILKNTETRPTFGYIASTSLLIYTHLLNVFLIIPQFFYYIFIFRHSNINIKYWLKVQLALFLSFLPWIYILSRMPRETFGLVNWLPVPTLNDLFETFIMFSNENLIIFLIFIVMVFICILLTRSKDQIDIDVGKKEIYYLLLWFLLPIILLFTVSLIKPLYLPRYLIGTVPALYILVSKGIYGLKNQVTIISVIILLILLSTVPILKYYSIVTDCSYCVGKGEEAEWRLCPHCIGGAEEHWRELVSFIEKNESDGNVILLYPEFIGVPFNYYYNKTKKSSDVILIYQGEGVRQINSKIDNKTNIWLVSYNYYAQSHSPSEIIDNLNMTYTMQYSSRQFKGVTVYKFLVNKRNNDK